MPGSTRGSGDLCSRRRALQVIAGSACGLFAACQASAPASGDAGRDAADSAAAAGSHGDGGGDAAIDPRIRVPLSGVPPGALRLEQGVLIGHDRDGVWALSAVCTHEGCLVQPDDGQQGCAGSSALVCACHCARYDSDGRVLGGPARVDLDCYLVRLEGEVLVVDPEVVVPRGSRTRT
jgi:cytochrome b6-f complex iron-sulfur subunit